MKVILIVAAIGFATVAALPPILYVGELWGRYWLVPSCR